MTAADGFLMWCVYNKGLSGVENGVFSAVLMEMRGGEMVPTGDRMGGRPELLRAFLAGQGFTCLSYNDEDDPEIVETWV